MLKTRTVVAAWLAVGILGGVGFTYAQVQSKNLPSPTFIEKQTPDQFTAQDILGANVYPPIGEKIGNVGSMLVTADSKIVGYVLEIGGFIGLGATELAVTADSVLVTHKDGRVIMIADLKKDTMRAAPLYQSLRKQAKKE